MTPLDALFEIRHIVDKTNKMDFDEVVKLVEEKFTSTNSAMDAICPAYKSGRICAWDDINNAYCGSEACTNVRDKQHQ